MDKQNTTEDLGINNVNVEDISRNTKVTNPKPVSTPIADSLLTVPETPVETDKPKDVATPDVKDTNIINQLNEKSDILNQLGLSNIKETMLDLQKKASRTSELEAGQGIDEKTIELNKIQSDIRAKSLDFRRQREDIQTEAGLTTAQRSAKLADVSRVQARELADLSIIEATQRDDLTTAQALVDRKVALEFEPLEQALQFQKYFYEENKDQFSLLEQREFEKIQQEKQVEIDKDKFKFQQFENTKLEYITNAKLNGAPNAVIQSILNSTDINKMITASGKYGYDPVAKANLANIYSQIGSRDAEKKGKIINLPELTGVPTTDIANIIDATSAKATQSMTNATNVLASLQSFAQRNTSGEFGGIAPIRTPSFLLGETSRAEKQANVGDIEAINLKVQQWASGASLTEEQTKKVNRLVPENNDTDRQVRNKTNQLANFMVGQIQGELTGQGINYIPSKIDFFNQDPLGVGTPVGENDPLGIN